MSSGEEVVEEETQKVKEYDTRTWQAQPFGSGFRVDNRRDHWDN